MSWFDPYANGTRLVQVYEDPQPGSFNSIPSAQLPESGPFLADYSMAALESATLCDGQDGGLMPGGGVAERLDGHYFFTDTHMYNSRMKTEQHHGTRLSASSFDSVVSDSIFASVVPTTSSLVEQEEDLTDDMDNILEDTNNILWQPELLPTYEDNPFMNGASHCQAHESMCVAIENYHHHGIFDVEESMNNPEIDVVLSEIDTVKGVAQKEKNRKRKRSDESKKYPCEIRISKKIPKDGKYLKEKAWIGTFATLAQKGRALDVGKYFLSVKKKTTFSDPNSEKILSACKGSFHALPLAERVEKVIKLAKYYGENGLLPQSLNSL